MLIKKIAAAIFIVLFTASTHRDYKMSNAAGIPDDLLNEAIAEGKTFNIEPELILAVIKQESDFDVNSLKYEPALNDNSIGYMQVLLNTAKSMGFTGSLTDLQQTHNNLYYGTLYLKTQLNKFGYRLGIAAYNSGVPIFKDDNGVSVYFDGTKFYRKVVDAAGKTTYPSANDFSIWQIDNYELIDDSDTYYNNIDGYFQSFRDSLQLSNDDISVTWPSPANLSSVAKNNAGSIILGVLLAGLGIYFFIKLKKR